MKFEFLKVVDVVECSPQMKCFVLILTTINTARATIIRQAQTHPPRHFPALTRLVAGWPPLGG
jgi:hypothetical protein